MQYKWFKMILQFTIKPGVVDFLITTALCFVIVSTVSMVTTGLVSLKWIYNNICGMCFLILYCDLTSTVTALSFIPIMNRSVTTNLFNDAGLQHCLSVTWDLHWNHNHKQYLQRWVGDESITDHELSSVCAFCHVIIKFITKVNSLA